MNTTPNTKSIAKKVKSDYVPPLIISVHGIRTHGTWQKVFASAVSGSKSKVESFDYGRYNLLKFLMPSFNRRLVDEFYEWYGATIKSCKAIDLSNYQKRPSVVAHSLGSWIVGMAMLKYKDIRFDKLIFVGSVLPTNFDWGTLFAQDQMLSVLNEYAPKDPWPKWAGRLVAEMGKAGSEGFEWYGSSVENDRWEFFGHSDGTIKSHIENQWLPFLHRRPSPLVLLQGRNIQDGEKFSEILEHSGTEIDDEAYGEIPYYPDAKIPPGLSLEWIGINPDIYTFLMDRETGNAAGYLNAMPVTEVAYDKIRKGRLKDNEILPEDILPFIGSNGGKLKLYLMSIAISKKHRRWGEGIHQRAYYQLLMGFLEKLMYYGLEHKVRVTHFLATAWTPEGHAICSSLGMTKVGQDEFEDPIFELDLSSSSGKAHSKMTPGLKRLIKVYNQI